MGCKNQLGSVRVRLGGIKEFNDGLAQQWMEPRIQFINQQRVPFL